MTSAVARARARIAEKQGAAKPESAEIIRHPASDGGSEPGKIAIPAGVVEEVSRQVASDASEAKARAAINKNAVLARLKSETHISQFGDFVVKGEIGGRVDVFSLDSEAGGDYIRQKMQEAASAMPPKSAVEDIRAMMRIDARAANRRLKLHQRVASFENNRYIDLGNKEGQCVLVTADGWEIAPNVDIAFTRGRGYGELPVPIRPGSTGQAFKLVFNWCVSLGIRKSRAALVVVALVTWLRTGNAYPLLLLFGPSGAGKTMAALLLMLLTDPTDSMKLPSIQTDTEHIAAAAQHRWVLTFDNESKLSGDEQDLLCVCSTGGEIVTRKLYSNGDIATLPIHRPVLLTALQPVVTRPDLMSRTIPIEFAPRESRRGEDEILAEFMELRPALLGALCELLVAGEKNG